MSSFDTAGGDKLREVLDYCKSNNITTFWNKEDPVNYDAFIDVAKYFDFIFTSHENIMTDIKDTGNSNVFALPFAAQPIIHNPIRNFYQNMTYALQAHGILEITAIAKEILSYLSMLQVNSTYIFKIGFLALITEINSQQNMMILSKAHFLTTRFVWRIEHTKYFSM